MRKKRSCSPEEQAKNWVLTAWASPFELRALHIIEGATHKQVCSYASRLWDIFGDDLEAITYKTTDGDEFYWIGG